MRPLFALVMLAWTAAASATQPPYDIYQLWVSTDAQLRALTDSSLRLLEEAPSIGLNTAAVRKGEHWQLWLTGVPYRFVSQYQPHIPDDLDGGDPDYRTEWLTYEQIISEWDELAERFPGIVEKSAIGQTHHGATIFAYRVFRPEVADMIPPQSMVLVGLTHAREWISASCLLHIGKTVSETLARGDSQFTNLLAGRVGLYFVPVLNIDGYKYSWNYDRAWRKNRRDNGGGVYGVDINRNYSFGWGGSGSSSSPSSSTYRGPAPFSEPENLAMKNLAESLPGMKGFVDYHTQAGMILYPWGHTGASLGQPHLGTNVTIANAMKSAIIQAGGYNYTVGQAATTLYHMAGNSADWFLNRFGNIPSFTFEVYGANWDPPTSSIAWTQDQHWIGFKSFIEATIPPP